MNMTYEYEITSKCFMKRVKMTNLLVAVYILYHKLGCKMNKVLLNLDTIDVLCLIY